MWTKECQVRRSGSSNPEVSKFEGLPSASRNRLSLQRRGLANRRLAVTENRRPWVSAEDEPRDVVRIIPYVTERKNLSRINEACALGIRGERCRWQHEAGKVASRALAKPIVARRFPKSDPVPPLASFDSDHHFLLPHRPLPR